MKKIIILIVFPLLLSCSKDDGGTTPATGYQINVGQPQLLAENGYHPKWSPADNYIAYTSNTGGNMEIWLLDLDSGITSSQVSGLYGDMTITWNPDGSAIAFEAFEGEHNMQIWILWITTGNLERLTNYSSQLFQPEWSKSGPMFLAMSRMEIVAFNETGDNFDLINLGTDECSSPSLEWNGQRFSFTSEQNGNHDIWIANINGSGLTQITTHSSWDHRSRWSPDGNKLVFESDRSGARNIWIYDFISETFAQVTTQGGDMPDWSPDGTSIVYVHLGDLYTVTIEEVN